MWQLLFWLSFAEIILFPTVIDMDKKDREPGDFALDPLNLCKASLKSFSGLLLREPTNQTRGGGPNKTWEIAIKTWLALLTLRAGDIPPPVCSRSMSSLGPKNVESYVVLVV